MPVRHSTVKENKPTLEKMLPFDSNSNVISKSIFINHSQKHSSSFSPRFCKFKSKVYTEQKRKR